MSEAENERRLAECLEDYHRRRARGEVPAAEDYLERLEGAYREFLEVLEVEAALDEAIEPPDHDLFPKPFGDYTLLGELGRGAMGVVYEAVHRGLGRKVALKILRTGFDTEPAALERFRREAQACAQIRHDHIVEIYEAGHVDDRPFYAMPLLDGESLISRIRSDEPLDPKELCRGLAGIADALHHLHEAGIVHRDVKPGNIMVEPNGRMVLADFGLARTASSHALTRTGETLGTPLYMSPEQLLGRRAAIDRRTDVYGLGVTLYEGLTRRPPFKADEVTQLMRMILAERPQPPQKLAPEIPRDCAFIAMKAMERKKEDRYDSAALMRDDLLAFAEDRAVSGRPVSELRHGLRRARRHLPAAAAAVLAAAVFLYWYGTRPATLSVMSYPVAEISVDGEPKGKTPLQLSLDPGEYDVSLRLEGFQERTQRISLGAGRDSTLQLAMIAENPEDPAALARLGNELDHALQRFERAARTRGTDEGGVEALYPRGKVRVGDLQRYRIDCHELEVDGTLEFRRGDEVLWSANFDPENILTETDLPEAVVDALRPGDLVTWGYFPKDGKPMTASFEVVDPDLPDLAVIDERLKEQHWITRSHFRAQIYLDAGLDYAAFEEARRIARENGESVRAWAVMQEALKRMGLEDTGVWIEVQKLIDKLPQDQLAAVYR